MLNYKLEMLRELRNANAHNAGELLNKLLKNDSSVTALDSNSKGQTVDREYESPLFGK